MSTEATPLSSEALSQAIREKVAEANKLQRHLTEAAIRGRAIQTSLRHTLDEISAYMYRETGLDVVAGHHAPGYILTPLNDTSTSRVTSEFREITVPTEPPTSLLGGFQVSVSTDGDVAILAFWAAGDARSQVAHRCWTELIEGQVAGLAGSGTVKQAADKLFSQRLHAAELLLNALNAAIPST